MSQEQLDFSRGPLSKKQQEVLQLFARGLTPKRVAEEASSTEKKVYGILIAACKKLGAANVTHAVYLSMQKGWIE